MESEFIALDKTGEEAEWLQNFLEDIPYWSKPVAPSKDNVSDPLIKGLSREGAERIFKGMGLRPRTRLGYSLVSREAPLTPAIPSISSRDGGIFLPLVIKSLCVACGSNTGDGTENKLGSWLMFICFQTSAYPSHDKFINKKIDMFDKISLMYGSDRARGDCVELFGDINVDCNSEQRNDDIEGSSTERDVQDIVSETSLSQGNPQKKSFFEYSRYGR
ncbi:hypothetical protein FXO38_22819 [Capsicum annuum]|nr:hypothetical protein FXO38_22819 [Capsicum annuum]KAF3642469.1 hypothetical protein FXO37_22502 [Capsicum annuum]